MLTRISDAENKTKKKKQKTVKMAEDMMIKNLMEKMIETKPTKE